MYKVVDQQLLKRWENRSNKFRRDPEDAECAAALLETAEEMIAQAKDRSVP